MFLELGGGTNPHRSADIVIDLHHPRNSPLQDATAPPWLGKGGTPVPMGSCDVVYSSHFLEHVPHGGPLIKVMNESFRVLRSGGVFEARMPLVGYTDPYSGQPMSGQIGWQPWADPTHVSFWWLPEAFMYFCEGPFKPHADYGLAIWKPMGPYVESMLASGSCWTVYSGWEGHIRLERP